MSDKSPGGSPLENQQSQDNYYESLLEMEKNDPVQYSKLSPALKMSVGYYVERKQQAEQSQGEGKNE